MIGTTVAQYRILSRLGSGGMGDVYRAEDTRLHREVALKFLPELLLRDQEARKRFLQEARAASRFDHPNICTVYEINETADGQIYIAMALHEGETLKAKLESGALSVEESIRYAGQLLEGLKAAHDAGIVHRDIKPANLICTPDGSLKIVDFGVAKIRNVDLTRPQTSVGTIAYMAPEQARGDAVDHRADIWSAGIVLFEMLAGSPPFQGDYQEAVLYSILHESPRSLADLRPDVPDGLVDVVARALSKEPEQRYQNAAEMARALVAESAAAGSGYAERDAVPEPAALGRQAWLVSALGILIVALLLIALKFSGSGSSDNSKVEFHSIAVLPFADLSPGQDQEYFCDGMTEEILTKLAKVPDLKVIARTSVMPYRRTKKSVPEIAAELGVETVLEGSIRRDGDDIRVTAQLIDASDASHLWADNFDRKFAGVFKLQEEIALEITAALRLKLSPETEEALVNRQPEISNVHDDVLRGTHHLSEVYMRTKSPLDFQQALDYFDRALAVDSTYAPAVIRKAEAFHLRWVTNSFSDQEALQQARKLAELGVKLDPGNALAHAMLGQSLITLRENERATDHLQRALRLNPSSDLAAHASSFLFYMNGMVEEMLAARRRALELSPRAPHYYRLLARYLTWFGRPEEAEATLDLLARRLPQHPALEHIVLEQSGLIDLARGEYDAMATKLARLNKTDSWTIELDLLAAELALAGQLDSAMQVGDPMTIYTVLGDTSAAWNEAARRLTERPRYVQTVYGLMREGVSYRIIRNDPRFPELLEKERPRYESLQAKYKDLGEFFLEKKGR